MNLFRSRAYTAKAMATHAIDPELVEAAAASAPAARDRLVETWLPVVYGWCARLGGPRVDPEDAAHEVFLVVFARLPGLRRKDRFPSWLFGVTRRVLASHRRRAWVRRWLPGRVPDLPDAARDPEDAFSLSELELRVQQALAVLPEKQREVLVLCDVEERTLSDAAHLLEVPIETVHTRLRRARDTFRVVARNLALLPLLGAVSDRAVR